ncbi:hypothetical protein [Paenibacillus sp. HW567]|uniref:hypothetical protein n=1 Tax=Paenibacillus sp. HW567 TaxID=1034769 RepID=UPI00037C2F05|nr:hypothetical protein [Paenibacillus sp. HW567]
MGSLIYVAVVIIVAIISSVNKAVRNKSKNTPGGGMPTFGGGDGSLRRVRPVERQPETTPPMRDSSGFPAPGDSFPSRTAASAPESEYDASPAWSDAAEFPSPDYETGEGMSLEQSGEEDGVRMRSERMQRELEVMQARFDGAAAAVPSSAGLEAAAASSDAAAGQASFTGGREALRTGLVWAEILGPPRARQPHSSRR